MELTNAGMLNLNHCERNEARQGRTEDMVRERERERGGGGGGERERDRQTEREREKGGGA